MPVMNTTTHCVFPSLSELINVVLQFSFSTPFAQHVLGIFPKKNRVHLKHLAVWTSSHLAREKCLLPGFLALFSHLQQNAARETNKLNLNETTQVSIFFALKRRKQFFDCHNICLALDCVDERISCL